MPSTSRSLWTSYYYICKMQSLRKGILGLFFYIALFLLCYFILNKNIHYTYIIAISGFIIFAVVQSILFFSPTQPKKKAVATLLAISIKFIFTMALLVAIMYFYGKTTLWVWIIFGISYIFNTLMTKA